MTRGKNVWKGAKCALLLTITLNAGGSDGLLQIGHNFEKMSVLVYDVIYGER